MVSLRDSLGDRMKIYEGIEAERILMPRLPVIARIDGRAFHTLTRGLDRPFDVWFSNTMIETTQALVEHSNALIGYTQSDEISLVFYAEDADSEMFFNGRTFKLTSVLASIATAYFNRRMVENLPRVSKIGFFDCRVWSVPNKEEALDYLIWREQDAVRNSISMAAQAKFSHKELHKKTASQMQEMLFQQHGINWNAYPARFKRGTYVRRVTTSTPFTAEEIEQLPPKHAARANPNLQVIRSRVVEVPMPPLTKVRNRVAVVFNGEDPESEPEQCVSTT